MLDIAAARKWCEAQLTGEERGWLDTWLHRDDYFGAVGLSNDVEVVYRLAATREALEEARGKLAAVQEWRKQYGLQFQGGDELDRILKEGE